MSARKRLKIRYRTPDPNDNQDDQLGTSVPMDRRTFRDLTESDANLAWSLVKKEVVTQLIGDDDVIPVPFLDEPENFDLFCVIIKEKLGRMESIRGKAPTMHSIGSLRDYLIAGHDRIQDKMYFGRVVTKFNPNYEYKVSDMKRGEYKVIRVVATNTEMTAVALKQPDLSSMQVNLDAPGLEQIHKFFIITEVYHAKTFQIHAVVDDKRVKRVLENFPIAFKYQKYQLTPQGQMICQDHEESFHRLKRDGFWIPRNSYRHPRDPLPPAPESAPSGSLASLKAVKRNPRDPLPPVPKDDNSSSDDDWTSSYHRGSSSYAAQAPTPPPRPSSRYY